MRCPDLYILCFLILTGLISPGAGAQDVIDKEIVVVKPYQPSLSDAFKINILPRISDSVEIQPRFDYTIDPKPYETGFRVRPITPASLVGLPLSKLYKTYLKLGVGNYLMPLGELHINSLRSRENQWGVGLRHYSLNGKLKLDNGEKVSPGFFENSGSLYGRKILRNATLSGMARAAYDGGNFYGYNTVLDTSLSREDILQNYLKIDVNTGLASTHEDSMHLNYAARLDYQYTLDHYNNGEHGMILDTRLNKLYRSGSTFGLDLSARYFYTTGSIDSASNAVIGIQPWMGRNTPEYTYRVGLNLLADARGEEINPHFYPEALLQIHVVRNILSPYFGVDGALQLNNLRSVISDNPYITPGVKVLNTSRKARGFLGIKGNYTSRISYDLGFSYSLLDQVAFFVNDTNVLLGNTFDVVYDDAEKLSVYAELQYHEGEKLNITVNGSYQEYKLELIDHPWHKPAVNLSLDARYNLKDKILMEGGLQYIGKRYAQGHPSGTEAVSLGGYAELDLALEYRYTKILSAFVRMNHIIGSRKYIWNHYPSVGFNLMAGFTYAL